MYFSQQDIDNETMGGQILTNNPNGGAGGDSTAYCLILPDPNNPTKPLKWKPSLDSTDESTWHNIGIPYYPGNSIGFQVYDFKNVASAYNTQQTVFNMGIKHRTLRRTSRPDLVLGSLRQNICHGGPRPADGNTARKRGARLCGKCVP